MGEFNIKSTTIEKSLDMAKELLGKLVGQPIEEMGLLLSDNVKMWRLRNQIRNLEKVKAIVEEESIPIKQVNLKVLFPYLDGVSLEDDETLQAIWARLFTNYIDSRKNLNVVVYPSILKQLSSNEVKVLSDMKEHAISISVRDRNSSVLLSSEELSNLERLGLVAEVKEYSQDGGDSSDDGKWRWEIYDVDTGEFYLTHFAIEFLSACSK